MSPLFVVGDELEWQEKKLQVIRAHPQQITWTRDFITLVHQHTMGDERLLHSPRDARRLELSVCYHTGTSHFRTPSFLPSYHHGTVAVTTASVNLNILLDGKPSFFSFLYSYFFFLVQYHLNRLNHHNEDCNNGHDGPTPSSLTQHTPPRPRWLQGNQRRWESF